VKAALAVALLALAPALAGCGGDGNSGGETTVATSPPSANGNRNPGPDDAIGDRPGGPQGQSHGGRTEADEQGGGDPFSEEAGSQEAILAASVRSYVSAINRHDGAAVCQLLAPGALRGFQLPEPAPSCARSVGASIGNVEPDGPAWSRSRVDSIRRVELDPDDSALARVRALMVHRFANRREPSIEDDLIYLRRVGTAWLIAKPSSTFYRAIGARDVPLSALTPP
jgi:hypothetical protein